MKYIFLFSDVTIEYASVTYTSQQYIMLVYKETNRIVIVIESVTVAYTSQQYIMLIYKETKGIVILNVSYGQFLMQRAV